MVRFWCFRGSGNHSSPGRAPRAHFHRFGPIRASTFRYFWDLLIVFGMPFMNSSWRCPCVPLLVLLPPGLLCFPFPYKCSVGFLLRFLLNPVSAPTRPHTWLVLYALLRKCSPLRSLTGKSDCRYFHLELYLAS